MVINEWPVLTLSLQSHPSSECLALHICTDAVDTKPSIQRVVGCGAWRLAARTDADGFLLFFFSAGVLINIECKAWAKNIYHDRHERRGSVHFELMVD